MKTSILIRAVLPCLFLTAIASAAGLKVDKEKSRIHVDAKATGHNFTGTLTDYQVTAKGDAATMEPTSFKLAWKFKNLETADTKRDAEMIKWLKGGDPAGNFEFYKMWHAADGTPHAIGKLTILGVTKEISFPYTVKSEGKWVTITGTASLDYTDFKLPKIRSMALMTVDPKLKVRFHIVGELD